MLKQSSDDYLLWMISNRYSLTTRRHHERVLRCFLSYVKQRDLQWDNIFTFDTLKNFQKEKKGNRVCAPIRELSLYLFRQKKIDRPIEKPKEKLPEIYEEYLIYYEKSKQVHPLRILRARRTLSALKRYLNKQKINLARIKIEHLDTFLAKQCAHLSPVTCQNKRSCIRGFLRYLYRKRKVIRRDLASFLVGAPMFADAKPPRFLRPIEIQRLFACLEFSSPRGLRANAMIHLAYTLGLRPKEISLIRLDDISFRESEISLRDRKSLNPIRLPLPEITVKAITAYIVGARPDSKERFLFLSLRAPYKPVSPGRVSNDISICMKKAGLPSSAYWLRHTYAQNLMESGISIFEIKQMMGHDRIQTTKRYIQINTKLMREVLFDETF